MKSVFKLSILSLVALAGCATPPGQFKESDMDFVNYTVGQPIAKVTDKLQDYERKCGGLVNEFAATWYPPRSDKSITIDLFLKGIGGAKQDWVAGIIVLNEISEASTGVKIGVNKTYSRPVFGKSMGWVDKTDRMIKQIEDGSPLGC